jgi:hypothetical protein
MAKIAKKKTVASSSTKSTLFSNTLGKIKGATFNRTKTGANDLAKTRGSLPSGNYSMRIEKIEEKESQNGNNYISWTLKVTDGDFKGKSGFKRSMLQTEDNLQYLLADVAALGFDVSELEDTSELIAIFKQLTKEKPVVNVTVAAKDDGYVNYYFNGIVEESAEEESEEEDEEADEESEEEADEEEAEESDEEEAEEEESDEEESEDEETEEDEEESEESEDDEEEVELEVGNKVSYKHPKTKKKSSGKVTKINASKGTVSVKDKDGTVIVIDPAKSGMEIL